MLRNTETERVVYGVSDTFIQGQFVTLGEAGKTLDARLAAPRRQTKRIKVVDTVGYAEPPHQGGEANAAGYDEGQRLVA